jgi:hypothetical protein
MDNNFSIFIDSTIYLKIETIAREKQQNSIEILERAIAFYLLYNNDTVTFVFSERNYWFESFLEEFIKNIS